MILLFLNKYFTYWSKLLEFMKGGGTESGPLLTESGYNF